MVPENIVWAFFSPSHYQQMKDESVYTGRPAPNDTYYKDFSGKWVKVTSVFECIEKARNEYRFNDAKYLGGVLVNTRGEVARGGVYPPPVIDTSMPQPQTLNRKKKRLNKVHGASGTVSVKKLNYFYDPLMYSQKNGYTNDDNY